MGLLIARPQQAAALPPLLVVALVLAACASGSGCHGQQQHSMQDSSHPGGGPPKLETVSMDSYEGSAVMGEAMHALGEPAVPRRGLNAIGLGHRTVEPEYLNGVDKIAVLGERHSGTNFMKVLLRTNFPNMEVSDWFCEQKHKYQTKDSKHCSWKFITSTIVVVMFRNPYDWALGMHRNCYCGEPGPNKKDTEAMAALPFEKFMTQPWMDNSHKYWTGSHHRIPCKHLMECRALKHLNFLNMTRWARFVEFVRHEDVMLPQMSLEWVKGFAMRYNLSLGLMDMVDTYKGAGPAFNAEDTIKRSVWFNPSLTADDGDMRVKAELITKQMDLAVESLVGYSPRDWTLRTRMEPLYDSVQSQGRKF